MCLLGSGLLHIYSYPTRWKWPWGFYHVDLSDFSIKDSSLVYYWLFLTNSSASPENRCLVPLGVSLENFPLCKELLIPPGTQNYMVRMRLYDVNRRQLNLTIRIACRAEGSLKIFISAPYWLINKTGIPGDHPGRPLAWVFGCLCQLTNWSQCRHYLSSPVCLVVLLSVWL